MSASRRQVLLGGAAAAAAASLVAGRALLAGGAPVHDSRPVAPNGLRWHAARKGMSFGTETNLRQVRAGGPLIDAILREADTIVPGTEMKWGVTGKAAGRPDYAAADEIVAFASAHALRLRGHTAFWYRNVPAWAAPELAGPDPRTVILARVGDVVGHFRGRVFEWDVVNEAVDPHDGQPDGLRLAPFGRPMGSGWIADCFHAAGQADPSARLFYNDYGLENAFSGEADRRTAVLNLLTDLRRRGAPVHGLGMQTHVGVGQRFDAEAYRGFLREVSGLGLAIRLTEFDVNDKRAGADVASRDAAVADRAREILDAAFDERAVKGLMSWGLQDSQSFMQKEAPRGDGQEVRPLPLDDQLRRKPLWTAIARAFDGAPPR